MGGAFGTHPAPTHREIIALGSAQLWSSGAKCVFCYFGPTHVLAALLLGGNELLLGGNALLSGGNMLLLGGNVLLLGGNALCYRVGMRCY